jgi:hypothetical protein
MGIIIEGSDYKTMHRNLIQKVEENEEEEEDVMGVPVCGANLTSPVFDTINYIREVHYKIGTRLYIENAD